MSGDLISSFNSRPRTGGIQEEFEKVLHQA